MRQKHIVITYRVNDEQLQLYKEYFDKKNILTFLKDVPHEERPLILSDADVLISWNPPRELKEVDKKYISSVKFVQLLSAGFDQVDFNQFSDECIIACNSGAFAEPMAEHIAAMILSLSKNLLSKHNLMANGKFDQNSLNRSIKNYVCGVIGFGGIGKATAKILRAFDVKINAINTSGRTDEKVDFIGTLKDLNYILKNSDIIIISIPLLKETEGLIGKKELDFMKPDTILINAARGQIIDEEALFNHLKNNKNFLAGIDAWWTEPFSDGKFKLNFPFFDLPNVLGSPHNSALVPGALLEGAKRVAKNVLRYLENEEIKNIVNKK